MRALKTKMHKIALFGLEHTLLMGNVIGEIESKFDFARKRDEAECRNNDVSLSQTAKRLRGISRPALLDIIDGIPLASKAGVVVKKLNTMGYATAIVSGGYDCVARHVGNQIGIDFVFAPQLDFAQDKATGQIRIPDCFQKQDRTCCEHDICTGHVVQFIAERCGVALADIVAVGNDAADVCMVKLAGCGISHSLSKKDSAKHSRYANAENQCLEWLVQWNEQNCR